MAANHSADYSNKSLVKASDATHGLEETFLNAFIDIAKKGIADWEHLRKMKKKDG